MIDGYAATFGRAAFQLKRPTLLWQIWQSKPIICGIERSRQRVYVRHHASTESIYNMVFRSLDDYILESLLKAFTLSLNYYLELLRERKPPPRRPFSTHSNSLSLRFNGHFPGEPGLAGVYWSKGWWMRRWQLDYLSYKSCKAPVKSSPPTNQHPVFLQAGCPSCRPTNNVKALKGIISHSMDLLTRSSPGVFQLCLWPIIAPGYLGEGCHASHQPSDASTHIQVRWYL